MDTEARAAGFAVPIVLILWVVGVAFALSSIDTDPAADSPSGSGAPDATPVAIPTSILVGAELDEETGQVAEPQPRFDAGSTVAFSVWLGAPVGADHVLASLALLEVEGFVAVGEPLQVAADPESLYLAGEIPADLLLEQFGPGTYLLKLELPSAERIGYGEFQIGTDTPEEVEVFIQGWRNVSLAAGEHVGYRFDAAGEIVEERAGSLDAPTEVPAMHRATFAGENYLFIKGGAWENYYLPESEAVRLTD